VRDDLTDTEGFAFLARRWPDRSRAVQVLWAASFTALLSAAVCVGAVLVPAPAAALPLVVVICLGCPLFAAWEVPMALASLRAGRVDREQAEALAKLRQTLERLPETEHPLGL